MTVHPQSLPTFSELPLLRSLSTRQYRPNVLIRCERAFVDTVLTELQNIFVPPFQACPLPGRLDLPEHPHGTIVLKDVAALTLEQQMILSEWLSGRDAAQVVSVTQVPLFELVQEGRFLEGLFYRLNTVYLEATSLTAISSRVH